ncbi:MAG: hypothetical protein ABI442_20960 [Gemmatimonadaceae bacterium]
MKRKIPDFSKKKNPSQHPQAPTPKGVAPPPTVKNIKPQATSAKSGRRGT